MEQEQLLAHLEGMQERRLLRRVAAILFHRRAGFSANGMGVWQVPEDRIMELGPKMAAFRGISHCYQRPTYRDWPYSIFTMAHGRSKEECDAILDSIADHTGIVDRATLYSSTEFKKIRLLYFTGDTGPGSASTPGCERDEAFNRAVGAAHLTGPRSPAGWGYFPGQGHAVHRAGPHLHSPGRGRHVDRRGRQRVRRLGELLGAADSGPRAPGRGRRRRGGRDGGLELWRSHRAGGQAGRGDNPAGALGTDGPDDLLRHRGHDERAPAGRVPPPAGVTCSSSPAPITATWTGCWPRPDPASATQGLPASAGVDQPTVEATVIVPWNDPAAVREASQRYQLAATCFNRSRPTWVVPPSKGFLELLRACADHTGALLIFDEVITGFRVGLGGAQERYDVLPDLTILGKIVGEGFRRQPTGGRPRLWERVAPAGDVYQAGTLSGNPLAMAAALATLHELDGHSYERLDRTTTLLADGLREAAAEAGVPLQVQSVTGLLTPFFSASPVRDYAEASSCDLRAYGSWCRGLLERGVYPPASQFEAWFPSLAHTPEDVERTVQAARVPSGRRLTRERAGGSPQGPGGDPGRLGGARRSRPPSRGGVARRAAQGPRTAGSQARV